MKNANKRKNNKARIYTVIILAIIVVLTGYLVAAYQYSIWPFQNSVQQANITETPAVNNSEDQQKNNQSGQNSNAGSSIISNPDGNTGNLPTLPDNLTPKSPIGTFVSNHRPNINSKPYPSEINSTCTTTPGASCYIVFTNGETTKTLETKQTDSSGNVSWSWDVKDLNITAGTWKIKAVATNGPLSSESTDPIDLIVSE